MTDHSGLIAALEQICAECKACSMRGTMTITLTDLTSDAAVEAARAAHREAFYPDGLDYITAPKALEFYEMLAALRAAYEVAEKNKSDAISEAR
jgi:hypothetical protein